MTRRARPILRNALQRSMARAAKVPVDDQLKLTASITAAVDALQFGKADGTEFGHLADALNTAEALSDLGICSDAGSRGKVTAGLHALAELYTRHSRTKSWTLKATEIAALRDAVWLHSVQLEHCSVGEFEQARTKVENVCRGARAGNAGPGVTVLAA